MLKKLVVVGMLFAVVASGLGGCMRIAATVVGAPLMLGVGAMTAATARIERLPPDQQHTAPWCGPQERAELACTKVFSPLAREDWIRQDYRCRIRSSGEVVWMASIDRAVKDYAERTGLVHLRMWPFEAYAPCVDPLVLVVAHTQQPCRLYALTSTHIRLAGELLWIDPRTDDRPQPLHRDGDGHPFIPTTWGRLVFKSHPKGWDVEAEGPPAPPAPAEGFLARSSQVPAS